MKNKNSANRFLGILILVACVFLLILNSLFSTRHESSRSLPESNITDFIYDIYDDTIIDIKVFSAHLIVTQSDGRQYRVNIQPYSEVLFIRDAISKGIPVKYMNEVVIKEGRSSIDSIVRIISIIPSLTFTFLIIYFIMRMFNGNKIGGSNIFGMGGEVKIARTNVKMSDVVGIDESKREVEEVIRYLKNPSSFERIGCKIPRGILLCGQPGCGKTLLAKAISGECNVPFIQTSGSEFVELIAGFGALKVRNIFNQARNRAPCVIFIDEIDAIGGARSRVSHSNEEREQTLNQLLIEMDGFDTKEQASKAVIVIGATNRHDTLDAALLRPGRFSRKVYVHLPDSKGREDILRLHASKVSMSDNIDYAGLASLTRGTSGADLADIVNEAAIYASVSKRLRVTMEDMQYASEKVLLGGAPRKCADMTERDLEMTAYHESGHTIINLEFNNIVYKVTVVPRGNSLGMMIPKPRDGVSVLKSHIIEDIAVCMGGRAAEHLKYGANFVSTGASQDIKMATDYAMSMVERYGMTDLGIALLENKVLDNGTVRPISSTMKTKADDYIMKLVNEGYERALEILTRRRDDWINLSEGLLKYSTLDGGQINEVLQGKVPSGFNDDGSKKIVSSSVSFLPEETVL